MKKTLVFTILLALLNAAEFPAALPEITLCTRTGVVISRPQERKSRLFEEKGKLCARWSSDLSEITWCASSDHKEQHCRMKFFNGIDKGHFILLALPLPSGSRVDAGKTPGSFLLHTSGKTRHGKVSGAKVPEMRGDPPCLLWAWRYDPEVINTVDFSLFWE